MDKNLVLGDYRRWLLAVANRMVSTSRGGRGEDYEGRVQSLAQEGYIAMWRALDTFDPDKGALASWLVKAAEMRMADVVRRGVDFGQTGNRPPGTEEGLRAERSWEVLHPVEVEQVEQKIAIWLSEGLAMAYHRGEIQKAIGRLTQDEQRYVVLRFWHGKTNPEIDPHVEGNVVHLWRTAKGKLRDDLGRLA